MTLQFAINTFVAGHQNQIIINHFKKIFNAIQSNRNETTDSYIHYETATKDPGQDTFTFTVGMGQVIKGWDEGVLGMAQGEVSRLTCSPDYAYGSGGFPAWGIMPNSELIFEIELLSFK
jgi:FKBP-type peptidyl-prolyl cis-trans isomerase 2